MSMEAGLVAHLESVASLTALVGTRIYAVYLPAKVTLPAVTYQQISGAHEHSFQGSSQLAHPRFQITAHASTYLSAVAVRDALRNALDGYAGAMGAETVQNCRIENEGDLPDLAAELEAERVHMKRIDVVIWHTESVPTFT